MWDLLANHWYFILEHFPGFWNSDRQNNIASIWVHLYEPSSQESYFLPAEAGRLAADNR